MRQIMLLLEFNTDLAFPVGTFFFSNVMEISRRRGTVYDAATLEQYAQGHRPAGRLHRRESRRCTLRAAITSVTRASSMPTVRPLLCKMNAEARLMTRRMGKKPPELSKTDLSSLMKLQQVVARLLSPRPTPALIPWGGESIRWPAMELRERSFLAPTIMVWSTWS